MPKGVEHTYEETFELTKDAAKRSVMPKGVEHPIDKDAIAQFIGRKDQ